MVQIEEKAILLQRLSDLKKDCAARLKEFEQEKTGIGILSESQINNVKLVQDKIAKIENRFGSVCAINTYNEVDATITALRLELNF